MLYYNVLCFYQDVLVTLTRIINNNYYCALCFLVTQHYASIIVSARLRTMKIERRCFNFLLYTLDYVRFYEFEFIVTKLNNSNYSHHYNYIKFLRSTHLCLHITYVYVQVSIVHVIYNTVMSEKN